MSENEDMGFEAEMFSLRENTEILKTRKEGEAIHSVSRNPLGPLNLAEVKHPNTLVRFRKQVGIDEVMNELAELRGMAAGAKKKMAEMQRKIKENQDNMAEMRGKILESEGKILEIDQKTKEMQGDIEVLKEDSKRSKAAFRAGNTVMIRFFTEYACQAVTHGRTGSVSSVIEQAEDSTITISHSVDKHLAAPLPKVLDVEKHSATLKILSGLNRRMSKNGPHKGTIAGMALAIMMEKGLYELVEKEQHPGVVSLFEDMFGISVEEASMEWDSPLYGKLLETQKREAAKEAKLEEEEARLKKEAAN